ncbi:uncharacterized protein LOC123561647 [Mercenaria mercenaria]|uniref:uncharacterized protein LOC123561647 n=1 Tax=Mercenaria mercenaria TaxID=6596 RepID=UPI00234F115A|nr:uncharacterized protein LOC123561647 [Mercenaria mercenaria]
MTSSKQTLVLRRNVNTICFAKFVMTSGTSRRKCLKARFLSCKKKEKNLRMPSGREMKLWWAGEAESMFVYYLTGALGIALIASFSLTRSLRRKEPLVTELLHEDNTREDLVTYMLKLVTSPLPGCGCPLSVKVFMQLEGESKMSQYFQLRSNTGGKAMLRRGFTDIFLFKVPESIGEVRSVRLLVAGLTGHLEWKLEEAQLYSPAARDRVNIPVTATILEVLDDSATKSLLVQNSYSRKLKKIQLLYHQWLAMYGNAIRLGAFAEVVHVMSVFMSLFTLLVLSQMCYIFLPRGDHTLPTKATPKTADNEDEVDDSGPFDINFMSLFIGTAFTTVCCCILDLGLEILIRSVKSREKRPGKAYFATCGSEVKDFSGKNKLYSSDVEHTTFFACPLFLKQIKMKQNVVKDETVRKNVKHTKEIKHEVAFYLKQLVHFLQVEHRKYMKKQEDMKKRKAQEALEEKTNLEKEKSEKYQEKHENEDSLKEFETEEEETDYISIDLPKFSQMSLTKLFFSESFYSEKSEGSRSSKSEEFWGSVTSQRQKPQETYLDILKRKVFSRNSGRKIPTNNSVERNNNAVRRSKVLNDGRHEIANSDELESNGVRGGTHLSQTTERYDRIDHSSAKESEDKAEIFDRNLNATVEKLETLDRKVNASIKELKDTTARSDRNIYVNEKCEERRSDDCLIQIAKGGPADTETDVSVHIEGKLSEVRHSKDRNRTYTIEKGFIKTWQSNQKTWCRRVIKELCDVIRYTREMLLKDQIDFYLLKEKLLNISHTVFQLLMVACSVNCTGDQYDLLNMTEMLSLLWHMSMEILVYTLHEIFHVLQQSDNAVLADLVLQSNSVMVVVRHAVYPIMYIVQHGADKIFLMSHIPLDKDMECMVVELLKCCFELVVKYNLVLWKKLQFLVNMELKDCLDEAYFVQLNEFVDGNIHDQSTENTILKKLCNFVEESSRQEAWDEVHEEKKFFTTVLVKVQLLNVLKNKITKITKKKKEFDETHDLLPKEPKSRLELLVERRRKKPDVDQKHVKWSKDAQRADDTAESKEKLKEHSAELGYFVDNLTAVYEKLKRMMEREGLSPSMKASEFLAQAVLHTHVIVTQGEVDVPGKYKFDNYLHLKRTEMLLAQHYEETVKDLVGYLLGTAIREHNLKCDQHASSYTVLNDIIIKMDTLAELLTNEVDSVMTLCIKMERYMLGHTKNAQVETVVKTSVDSILQTPVLKKWSGLDLTNCTQSEISELGKMLDEKHSEMSELLLYYKNNSCPNQNNSNPGIVDVDDIDIEMDTKNVTLADIIEDLKPLKGYLEYLKHGELMRNMVTQMGYIERAKTKREYFSSIQISNIIDSYFMIDEGDDSKTLTKAGLYQLEHDCTGEDRKPLGSWVKTVAVMFMLLLQIFIVVYITMIGGQFSTTELQEWMCYYLLAVAVFGFVLEPFRACIVAFYMRKLQQKMWPKADRSRAIEI